MKIYLDNSVLNRPFDDQSIPQIRLETIALFFILDLIMKGKINLVSSAVIEFENSRNPFKYKSLWISTILEKAKTFQNLTKSAIDRAAEIRRFKISSLDALHLASAEEAGVDYFITSDYDVIRKYKGKMEIINPIDFIKIIKHE